MPDGRTLRGTLPGWVPWAAGLLWLALVLVAALLQSQETFWGRVGSQIIGTALGTALGVAFAVAGGSAILARWERRRWIQRTQYILFDLFDEAGEELSKIAATVYQALITDNASGAIPQHDLREAYDVPRTRADSRDLTLSMRQVGDLWRELFLASRRLREQRVSELGHQMEEFDRQAAAFQAIADATLGCNKRSKRSIPNAEGGV
jgi:hypothetical protein